MDTRRGAARTILVRDLNSHLLCPLCHGYFIDATTTVECLHSFCRSCIVRHLRSSKFCPACDVQLHKTRPLLGVRPDRTLQTLVYKLVPGLYHDEVRRRCQFGREYEQAGPDIVPSPLAGEDLLLDDDSVSLSIEYYESDSSEDEERNTAEISQPDTIKREKLPHRRYLQCPAAVSIRHLKKFLLLKYGLNDDHRVDVVYAGELLPDHFTLMDVAYTFAWKRVSPMMFSYRIFHAPVFASYSVERTSDFEQKPEECQEQGPSSLDDHSHLQVNQQPTSPTPLVLSLLPSSDPAFPNGDASSSSVDPEPPSQCDSAGVKDVLTAVCMSPGKSEHCPASAELSDDDEEPPAKKVRRECEEENIFVGEETKNISSILEYKQILVSNNDEISEKLECDSNIPIDTEKSITEVLKDEVILVKENEELNTNDIEVVAENQDLHADNASDENDSLKIDITSTQLKESCPKIDTNEQNDIDNLDSFNSMPGNEFNDPDEDENVLKILSTEEDEYDEPNMETSNKKDNATVVSENENSSTKEKIFIPEIRSKHKEGRKKSKHKSKHHHQRNDESTMRKRKTLRAEIISTPTVHQDPEDVMKLKVKLSPTANPIITGYSSSFNSSHHKHHHHHSKHHHSKHHYKQQNSETFNSSNRSNGEAASSAKERLLQMRAVRRKNAAASNKNAETNNSDIDEFPSSKSKKSPMIMPPSSITVSKITVSEKRKSDLQKSNSENESKRPSLEIMLVNAPSTQCVGHHSNINTSSSTATTKQASVNNNDTSPRQSEVTMTSNVNITKNIRQTTSTVPLMRIKKQVSSATIKPPSGLTITPKIQNVSSKVAALSKASPANKHSEHGRSHPSKDEKTTEDRPSNVEQNIRHDDIGALDLSDKSSRCKDIPETSPSPGLETCQSNFPSSSNSPGKSTTSSSHQSILSIAQSLVHKQLTSLQQQRSSNNSSPLSISPCSNAPGGKSMVADRGNSSPQRNRNSPNSTLSNNNTTGLAPLAMSNLQTLSDTAVHIRNLMAAQGSGKNLRMNISKQQMLAANLQMTQQKIASAHTNNASVGSQGRSNSSYVANSRVSPNSPQLAAAQHSRYQPNPVSRSPTSSQQHAVAGASTNSTTAPLRIPIPPSPLNKALSSAGRSSGSLLNSRNSVSLPRLHDLFSTTSSPAAGRGRAFPCRNNAHAVAKPGPNQAVRHIPNPSALMFRQNRQQQSQNGSLQNRNSANNTLTSGNSSSGNSNKVLYNQNQNFLSGSKTHDSSSGMQTMPPSVSSIRKMETMTRNIEKVAAGLTVRAVEANMNSKL